MLEFKQTWLITYRTKFSLNPTSFILICDTKKEAVEICKEGITDLKEIIDIQTSPVMVFEKK